MSRIGRGKTKIRCQKKKKHLSQSGTYAAAWYTTDIWLLNYTILTRQCSARELSGKVNIRNSFKYKSGNFRRLHPLSKKDDSAGCCDKFRLTFERSKHSGELRLYLNCPKPGQSCKECKVQEIYCDFFHLALFCLR